MYYAHPLGPPMPARPLYEAPVAERAMWDFHYKAHREAVAGVRRTVDNRAPACGDPKLEQMRVHTRRFAEHLRQREIGRENQQLVKRLYDISEGRGGRGKG